MIEADAGNPMLYNNRCWLKATRNIKTDTAVADCDVALKTTPRNAAALDSRALAWLRQGKFQQSIADYDAALAERPGQASSVFGRSLAKAGAGDASGAAADREAAMKINSKIAEEYADYGFK